MRVCIGLTLCLAHLALAGCASFDAARYVTVAPAPSAPVTWRGLPIAEGQIIVIERPGAMSLLLSLVAERFEPFIHAGLIVFEDGEPQVYEAFGSFRPRFAMRPTLGMGGGVRRVKLESFLKRDGIIAIYDPPPSAHRGALVEFAREHWRARTPFDEYFDASDPARFYCVEFVAAALVAAGGPPLDGAPLSRNPSLRVALDWLEIRTPRMLLAGELLAEERRVLLVDRRRTRAQIASYFERKRELHRRFTADQRLGNVFRWGGSGLRLRPQIQAYLDTPPDVAANGVQLAVGMFGSEIAASAESARAGGAR